MKVRINGHGTIKGDKETMLYLAQVLLTRASSRFEDDYYSLKEQGVTDESALESVMKDWQNCIHLIAEITK